MIYDLLVHRQIIPTLFAAGFAATVAVGVVCADTAGAHGDADDIGRCAPASSHEGANEIC